MIKILVILFASIICLLFAILLELIVPIQDSYLVNRNNELEREINGNGDING